MIHKVICPFCREKFSMEIFLEDGADQQFIYDCEVCCHPIDLHATWSDNKQRFQLTVSRGECYDEMPI